MIDKAIAKLIRNQRRKMQSNKTRDKMGHGYRHGGNLENHKDIL